MSVLAALLCIAGALCVLTLALMLWNLALYRAPTPAEIARGTTVLRAAAASNSAALQFALPLVTVCIPARNEAANLEACVRSALAAATGAEGHSVEVLVYDDHSTDATPEILAALTAADPRVRAATVSDLPEGWNGKQFACQQMGMQARGQWLLFTDADVRFAPTCIDAALGFAFSANAQLVSTFPRQVTPTLGEALVIPLIHWVLLSYLPLARMRSSNGARASAGCGQFLFVRRLEWLEAGGHAALRASMHDGIQLPRALRRAGYRTDLFDGTALVSCRMYRGFAQTWRGFTKNAYEGLGSFPLLVFITLAHALAHVLPWIVLVLALARTVTEPAAIGLAVFAIVIALAQRLLLAVRFEQRIDAALLHPVSVVLLTAIQWWSLTLQLRGRRTWRGRTA
ncbi:glycosyltransferase [soil metagenome]